MNSCFEVRKVKRRSDFFRFGFCRSRTRKSSNGSNFDWSTSSPLPPNSFALGVMITSFLSSCRSYPRIIVREGFMYQIHVKLEILLSGEKKRPFGCDYFLRFSSTNMDKFRKYVLDTFSYLGGSFASSNMPWYWTSAD